MLFRSILCVITYFIDLVIALVASDGMFKNIVQGFKSTCVDFISGAKKYTKTFIVLVIIVTSFLAYSGITYNFVPHIKKIKHFQHYAKIKKNPYRVKGNLLGAENADVVIELYSDYVCPLCYVHNIMLHRAAKEFSNIKIIHHNYPFDKECNKYINSILNLVNSNGKSAISEARLNYISCYNNLVSSVKGTILESLEPFA